MPHIEYRGGWARLLQEAAQRYWTAAEWAALSPQQRALALLKMDDGDAWTQAGIIGVAEGRRPWEVVNDWTAQGLLGPLGARRAA